MADCFEILSVRAADGGARLLIQVQSTVAGEVSRETLTVLTARAGRVPQKGEIDADALVFLRREHALCAALATALRSLAAGGGSRVQLQQKLCHKGVARDVAEECVGILDEKGYLDEQRGALAAAENGVRKLWGDRRILADLRAKGYGEVALCAAQTLLSERDGAARCAQLLRKRGFDGSNPEKLIVALLRYGYTRTEIRAALREVMGE